MTFTYCTSFPHDLRSALIMNISIGQQKTVRNSTVYIYCVP